MLLSATLSSSAAVVEKSVAAVVWPLTIRPLDFKNPRLNCPDWS
jgi:hypothetical protein